MLKMKYQEDFALNLIDEADEEFQARIDYDEEEINRLAKDIEQNGQRNPIGVWQKNHDTHQLIYGFQRVKAIKSLGHETIKANIYQEIGEAEAREHSISDNLRHSDLTELEQALECFKLKEKGYTVEDLCRLFGTKKTTIYNYLTIAKLDATTKHCIHKGLIAINHGVELARIENISKRLETLRRVIGWQYSIRELKNRLATGQSPTRMFQTESYVTVCPKSLKMEDATNCKKCEDHQGKDMEFTLCGIEGKYILCSYLFDIDSELMPLVTNLIPYIKLEPLFMDTPCP